MVSSVKDDICGFLMLNFIGLIFRVCQRVYVQLTHRKKIFVIKMKTFLCREHNTICRNIKICIRLGMFSMEPVGLNAFSLREQLHFASILKLQKITSSSYAKLVVGLRTKLIQLMKTNIKRILQKAVSFANYFDLKKLKFSARNIIPLDSRDAKKKMISKIFHGEDTTMQSKTK